MQYHKGNKKSLTQRRKGAEKTKNNKIFNVKAQDKQKLKNL
jgi:hypothetical protein